MRVSLVVYGALYVVLEMVGAQLNAVGWPGLTALDVATAVVNALLVVAVGLALLVGGDLLAARWRRRLRARRQAAALAAAAAALTAGRLLTVSAERAAQLALPAAPSPPPASGTAQRERYLAPGFLDEHGRLL